MKSISIKICCSNVVSEHTARIKEKLSSKNIVIEMEACLNKCSFCSDYPYVLINNQLFFGDDLEELIEILEEEIQ